MTIRITISSPPRAVQPNARSRTNWRAGHREGMRYKQEAAIEARRAMSLAGLWRPLWKRARVDVVRYVKDRRSIMDRDNLIASLKGPCDSLVLAGLLVDDHGVEWGTVEHEVGVDNPECGRVALSVTELEKCPGCP